MIIWLYFFNTKMMFHHYCFMHSEALQMHDGFCNFHELIRRVLWNQKKENPIPMIT
jgi:hypothetical protein